MELTMAHKTHQQIHPSTGTNKNRESQENLVKNKGENSVTTCLYRDFQDNSTWNTSQFEP